MEVFESKVRQVGTSLGVLIPKEVVQGDKIKKDQKVQVAILKKDLSLIKRAFGSVKLGSFKREQDHRDNVF